MCSHLGAFGLVRIVLPSDTPVGADFKAHLGLDDAVLDIAVTPNRPDLMSVIGVARELAAAAGTKLVTPAIDLREGHVEHLVAIHQPLLPCPAAGLSRCSEP